MTEFGCHLGLDTEFMALQYSQIADEDEFNLLVDYLQLNPISNFLTKPEGLVPSNIISGKSVKLIEEMTKVTNHSLTLEIVDF